MSQSENEATYQNPFGLFLILILLILSTDTLFRQMAAQRLKQQKPKKNPGHKRTRKRFNILPAVEKPGEDREDTREESKEE